MSSKGLKFGGGGAGGLGDDEPRLAPGATNPNWEGMPIPMTIAERLRRLKRYIDAVNLTYPPRTDDLTAIAGVIGSYLNGEIDDISSVDDPLRSVEASPVHLAIWATVDSNVTITRGNDDIGVQELTEIYTSIGSFRRRSS